MGFDNFLSSPRWEILQFIAERPLSPIELAEKLNTTVSYVSQQLKLLDAAGLVLKEKTGAVEKGKPRTLFTISKELLHFTVLSKDFSGKKAIHLDDYHKAILKIWMIDDSSLHLPYEKLFWKLQDNLKDVNGIFIEVSSPRLLILSDSKMLKAKIDSYAKNFDKKIDYSFLTFNSLLKIPLRNLVTLYAAQDLLTKLNV